MSVIGFDIGNLNCFVAIARAGGIETVDNEYSDRCTPAMVAFNSKQRLVGVSAKNQMITNLKSTVSQFKRLLGRRFDEAEVQEEIKYQTCKTVSMEDGGVGIEVNYLNEKRTFTPLQIMSMLLAELKNIAYTHLQKPITDCVISVPSFYTDYQRRMLLSAAKVVGLNCLKLLNETTAIALNYGLFKQDLPAVDQKPRHVVFVDMGHSALQVSIVAFNKGKIKILSTASDHTLGGRNFDQRLQSHFADVFAEKYKLDVRSNLKAWTRLGADVEKIKKQMSTNSTSLPLNIECLMNDIDVSHKICRADFEEMCKDLIERMNIPLQQALADSGIQAADVDFVELVGGSTRIPALKTCIQSIFQKAPSTTLNVDEAVARGCAIQCAMLSHTVKVRDIEVLDAATYPISISWDSARPGEPNGEMEVFKRHHSYPFTKLLTFPHRVEPFCFNAFYKEDVPIPHYERHIGKFIVHASAATEAEDMSKVKVKVKVRLDQHGCFTVSSASMVETLPLPPPAEKEEPMETTPSEKPTNEETKENEGEKQQENQQQPPPQQQEQPENNTTNTEEKKEEKSTEKPAEAKKAEVKKTKKSKSTDLAVTSEQSGPTEALLNSYIETENELVAQFRLEKGKADAKNAVEEYVYHMRDKLYGEYESYITEEARTEFCSVLEKTEDWLYEDGEDETRQVYADKLAELQKMGDPVVNRFKAYTNLPSAFEALGASITHFRKILDQYAQKHEQYAHIEEEEMKKVNSKLEEKFKWFNEKMQANAKTSYTSPPVVLPEQILTEKKLLEDFCNPIVTKPKPKVEPPKDDAKSKEDKKSSDENNEQPAEKMETDDKTNSSQTNNSEDKKEKSNLDMEVD